MSHFLLVAVVQSLHHLLENNPGLFLGEVPLVDDFVEELSASAHLSNHVYILLVLKGFVKLDDVGVVELLEDLDLVQKL